MVAPRISQSSSFGNTDHGAPVLWGGLITLAVGAALALAIGASSDPADWTAGLSLTAYMVTAAGLAAVVGLIFGVPRSRTDGTSQDTSRYGPNSNLEQISDWLTKVLVGAGLAQLALLPRGLESLGDAIGSDLGIENGDAIAVVFTLYGAGVGFAFGYLWVRLRLRVLLESSERQADDVSKTALVVATTLAELNQNKGAGETIAQIASTAALAAEAAHRYVADFPPVLWVDDHPENNTLERRILEALGVPVRVATSTQQALAMLDQGPYGLLISDSARREDGTNHKDAGLQLIRQVRATRPDLPCIVYTLRVNAPARRALVEAGAQDVLINGTALVSTVIDTLTRTAVTR